MRFIFLMSVFYLFTNCSPFIEDRILCERTPEEVCDNNLECQKAYKNTCKLNGLKWNDE